MAISPPSGSRIAKNHANAGLWNSRGVPAPVSSRMTNPKLYPGDMDQVALLHVLAAAQPAPAHAAAIEDEGEAAFHQFSSQLERLPRNSREQPCPIVIDRPPRRIIAVPTQELVVVRLGDARTSTGHHPALSTHRASGIPCRRSTRQAPRTSASRLPH